MREIFARTAGLTLRFPKETTRKGGGTTIAKRKGQIG
jgi:hypothetical protein